MSAAEEKLKKIESMINGIEAPGDYEEASMNASDGGNFDDAFSSGVSMGEAMLAEEIREVIND